MGTASCIAQLRNPKLSKNTQDLASRVWVRPLPGHKIQGYLDLVLCSKDTEILIQIVERTQLSAGTDTKQSEHIKPNQLLRNSCFTDNMTKHHAKTQDRTSFSPQLRGLSHTELLGDSNDRMSSDCQNEKLCIYTEGETYD